MNNGVFLVTLFLPFIFFLYLIFRRIVFGYTNKYILNYGLVLSVLLSFLVSILKAVFDYNFAHLMLAISNFVFLYLTIFSILYFKYKKKYIFTKIRYYIFLLLFATLTQLFILSDNLVLSFLSWLLTGVTIFLFLYFDIFKNGSDNNPNRFYSIILIGDFCFIISVFILIKYAIILNGYSYIINYNDIKQLMTHIMDANEIEYSIVNTCLMLAIFTRAFIFPFSCLFSFINCASNIVYLTLYPTLAVFYSLVLFMKLDLFNSMNLHFKIYLLIAILFILISLLFEKHFKIMFAYVLSVINSIFIIGYFYSPKVSYIALAVFYFILLFGISLLFFKDRTSFKNRAINLKQGFIQERMIIFITEVLPVKIASVIDFLYKKILMSFYALMLIICDSTGYYYTRFSQKRNVLHIIKGILIIFVFFALIATFAALFGNFGEIQS